MPYRNNPTLDGWFYEGADVGEDPMPEMSVGIRREFRRNGKPVAYLRSAVDQPEPITVLYQVVSTARYRSRRIRFSADLLNVTEGSGGRLWLRVTPADSHGLIDGNAFNYAYGYADATDEWQRVEVVVDVDARAQAILFGVGVWDAGEVWMSDARFEVVDESVPTTACEPIRGFEPREPLNLTFEG